MKVLITGAGGQLGRELSALAGENGVALARPALDVTDPRAVETAIGRHAPVAVINAAAYTDVDGAERDPDTARAVNRDGAAGLARACATAGIPLVHISTDFVFDGAKRRPYREDDRAAPLGAYGRSKWDGEEAVRQALDRHIILRTSWLFGRGGSNFVKTMLRLARSRNELRVVEDQTGCPTPAADLAAAIMAVIPRLDEGPSLAWGTYHFCGHPETTWRDFAEAIVQRAQSLGLLRHAVPVRGIKTSDYPTAAVRPAYSVLDTGKWAAFAGRPPPSWHDGLDRVLRSLPPAGMAAGRAGS